MKKQSKIIVSLDFGGVILPVVLNKDGLPSVPFKPVVKIVGAEWMNQYRRITPKSPDDTPPYLARRLGVSTELVNYDGQQREMICIRLDRVEAYFNSLNPDQLRGAGNENAADYLEQKHAEWDDLIHLYEAPHGSTIKEESSKSRKIRDLIAVTKEKRLCGDGQDKVLLGNVAISLANDLGFEALTKISSDDQQDDLFAQDKKNNIANT